MNDKILIGNKELKETSNLFESQSKNKYIKFKNEKLVLVTIV